MGCKTCFVSVRYIWMFILFIKYSHGQTHASPSVNWFRSRLHNNPEANSANHISSLFRIPPPPPDNNHVGQLMHSNNFNEFQRPGQRDQFPPIGHSIESVAYNQRMHGRSFSNIGPQRQSRDSRFSHTFNRQNSKHPNEFGMINDVHIPTGQNSFAERPRDILPPGFRNYQDSRLNQVDNFELYSGGNVRSSSKWKGSLRRTSGNELQSSTSLKDILRKLRNGGQSNNQLHNPNELNVNGNIVPDALSLRERLSHFGTSNKQHNIFPAHRNVEKHAISQSGFEPLGSRNSYEFLDRFSQRQSVDSRVQSNLDTLFERHNQHRSKIETALPRHSDRFSGVHGNEPNMNSLRQRNLGLNEIPNQQKEHLFELMRNKAIARLQNKNLIGKNKNIPGHVGESLHTGIHSIFRNKQNRVSSELLPLNPDLGMSGFEETRVSGILSPTDFQMRDMRGRSNGGQDTLPRPRGQSRSNSLHDRLSGKDIPMLPDISPVGETTYSNHNGKSLVSIGGQEMTGDMSALLHRNRNILQPSMPNGPETTRHLTNKLSETLLQSHNVSNRQDVPSVLAQLEKELSALNKEIVASKVEYVAIAEQIKQSPTTQSLTSTSNINSNLNNNNNNNNNRHAQEHLVPPPPPSPNSGHGHQDRLSNMSDLSSFLTALQSKRNTEVLSPSTTTSTTGDPGPPNKNAHSTSSSLFKVRELGKSGQNRHTQEQLVPPHPSSATSELLTPEMLEIIKQLSPNSRHGHQDPLTSFLSALQSNGNTEALKPSTTTSATGDHGAPNKNAHSTSHPLFKVRELGKSGEVKNFASEIFRNGRTRAESGVKGVGSNVPHLRGQQNLVDILSGNIHSRENVNKIVGHGPASLSSNNNNVQAEHHNSNNHNHHKSALEGRRNWSIGDALGSNVIGSMTLSNFLERSRLSNRAMQTAFAGASLQEVEGRFRQGTPSKTDLQMLMDFRTMVKADKLNNKTSLATANSVKTRMSNTGTSTPQEVGNQFSHGSPSNSELRQFKKQTDSMNAVSTNNVKPVDIVNNAMQTAFAGSSLQDVDYRFRQGTPSISDLQMLKKFQDILKAAELNSGSGNPPDTVNNFITPSSNTGSQQEFGNRLSEATPSKNDLLQLKELQDIMNVAPTNNRISVDTVNKEQPPNSKNINNVNPVDSRNTNNIIPVDSRNTNNIIPADYTNINNVNHVDSRNINNIVPADSGNINNIIPTNLMNINNVIPTDTNFKLEQLFRMLGGALTNTKTTI